jgi:hypothetical protein
MRNSLIALFCLLSLVVASDVDVETPFQNRRATAIDQIEHQSPWRLLMESNILRLKNKNLTPKFEARANLSEQSGSTTSSSKSGSRTRNSGSSKRGSSYSRSSGSSASRKSKRSSGRGCSDYYSEEGTVLSWSRPGSGPDVDQDPLDDDQDPLDDGQDPLDKDDKNGGDPLDKDDKNGGDPIDKDDKNGGDPIDKDDKNRRQLRSSKSCKGSKRSGSGSKGSTSVKGSSSSRSSLQTFSYDGGAFSGAMEIPEFGKKRVDPLYMDTHNDNGQRRNVRVNNREI